MSSKQGEVEAWSSAQMRQKLEEASPDDLRAIRESGLLPEKIAGILSRVENHYDPNFRDASDDPSRAEHTEKYQKIVRIWTSKVLSKAVHHGHDRIINNFIGVVEKETSISEVDAYLRFMNWVAREAGVTYLAGHMGKGKTDFGLLMIETFHKLFKDDDREVHIATNVRSTAEEHDHIDFVDNQPDLMEWLQENDGRKIFLFDEASSHATGYSGDASKVTKQFRSMIRLIRKHSGSMVIVGHDGKDLHPTVRELADYVEKQAKKDAAVFEAVQDREGEDLKFKITEIPQTSLYYDTKEASTWEWASEAEEGEGKSREIIMGELYVEEDDMTQDDVASYFEVSQSKVSEAAKTYREEVLA